MKIGCAEVPQKGAIMFRAGVRYRSCRRGKTSRRGNAAQEAPRRKRPAGSAGRTTLSEEEYTRASDTGAATRVNAIRQGVSLRRGGDGQTCVGNGCRAVEPHGAGSVPICPEAHGHACVGYLLSAKQGECDWATVRRASRYHGHSRRRSTGRCRKTRQLPDGDRSRPAPLPSRRRHALRAAPCRYPRRGEKVARS